ncbi:MULTISPECIES: AAA family ATPase [Phyllobacteriaceae]|jgi:AAA domain|uniref:Uncharacterized protein n=1 Tax=Mesorhizobium hungaricum TaxID=1566387 RepID=A0A1C2DD19_9HYPH|nr:MULTISPECIES: AAA family ATPase [Mesorhizobium]MBN9235144.1 AAA family ATPase [Mesorhizobium sp.]OCX12658.1 hypothetical protein QV13_23970 [Mesorhizobium hungaricum]
MNAIPPLQTFEAFEAEVTEALKPAFRSHFGAITWKDRKRPRRRLQYLVEDWLTTTGVSVIGGRSSSGKSFFALHLGMCIARGKEFFGLSVRRCGVVYQAGEGGLGLLDRMEAYAQHFEVPESEDIPFVLLPGKLDIFTKDKKDVDNFIAEVNHYSTDMEKRTGVRAGFICIDTLKKAAPGIDEISGKDNAVVLDNVYRIERDTGCHVCLVHHTNADGKKLRGHTSLRDDVEQVILIEHDKDTGIRDAVLDKIKDGEDGRKIRFTLIAVPVRSDTMEDGSTKEITSCAIVTVSEKERLKKEQEKQGVSVNPTERRILMNLFDAIDRYGKFVADEKDGPRAALGKTVVKWDYFRDVSLEKMPDVSEEERKKAIERLRTEFRRSSTFLLKSGVIGVERPFMWHTGKPIRGFPKTMPNYRGGGAPELPLDNSSTSPGMAEMIEGDGEIQL